MSIKEDLKAVAGQLRRMSDRDSNFYVNWFNRIKRDYENGKITDKEMISQMDRLNKSKEERYQTIIKAIIEALETGYEE